MAGLAADHHVTVMAVEKRNTLLSRIGGQKRVSFSGGVWPCTFGKGDVGRVSGDAGSAVAAG